MMPRMVRPPVPSSSRQCPEGQGGVETHARPSRRTQRASRGPVRVPALHWAGAMPRAAAATPVERFDGFSDEAIQFFLELQAEQSRTWFKAHQDDFLRLCRRPLELFVTELCERLRPAFP